MLTRKLFCGDIACNQMEVNQPTAPQTQPMPTPHEENVGFPAPRGSEEKKGNLVKWIIAGVGVIAIVVIGAIFVLRPPAETDTITESEDQGNVLQAVATPQPAEEPESTPSPTPEPVEKSEIAIQVLNGSGTPGDASLTADALEEIGFEDIEAANADEQDETETTLTYSSDVPQQIVDEIEAALEELFETVRVRRGTVSDDFDIRVLTGPKKNSTSDTSDTEDNETSRE